MAQTLNRLTARQVATATTPGRRADGGGLYLRVTTGGFRKWVYLATCNGKRVEVGLGSAIALSLAEARSMAAKMREAAARGESPSALVGKFEPEKPAVPSFGQFAEQYIASVEAGWKNPVHRAQWRASLRDHAANLRDQLIHEVGTDDVLNALRPIWLTKPETARRVRGRVEKILDAAKARGMRPRDAMNPAAWRGHLSLLLPSQAKLERGHHAALPYADAPAFMTELRARLAPTARCLEFLILTAARSAEALGATWGEVDLEKRLWSIPAARMKAGAEHVVPLSAAAIELLAHLRPAATAITDRIFDVRGASRSNMAMAMLLRRMGRAEITTHGFRSTFRDWAGDATSYPRELVEQALAHTITSKTERAYRRGTAVERRRELMEGWAAFLGLGDGD